MSKFSHCGKRVLDQRKQKKLLTEKEATTQGTPNHSWLDKHKLDHNSKPQDFYASFVPDLFIGMWTTYTIIKRFWKILGKKVNSTQIGNPSN